MSVRYETDVIAWANEQAAFLRSGRFDMVDIEHLAEEIEDVGKSEKREFFSRMVVLMSHLLKWKYQPARRGSSWEKTINVQRKDLNHCLEDTPSLKKDLSDINWIDLAWDKSIVDAYKETGIEINIFPENCPWDMKQILSSEFFPD